MLSATLHEAMNNHLKSELYSAYLYLSMSAYFESINFPGFAHWMRLQSEEERGHAMKFYQFVVDRGGRVILQAIEQPPGDFRSALDVAEQALAHEQEVTGLIDQLYGLAVQEKDYPSQAFLQGFVTEQVEEEKTATEIVETLRMIGDNNVALLMYDRELARRQAQDGGG
jgi:ferritin